MELFTGAFGIPIFLFLLCVAILWFLLPFAIFGVKDKLDVLIMETKKSNALLEKAIATLPTSDQDVNSFSASKCD